MIFLSILVVAIVAWLLWEWKTGMLVPERQVAGRRAHPAATRVESLPTAASLLVDADVAFRHED